MKRIFVGLSLAILALSGNAQDQVLFINEVMATNHSTLQDDFLDWDDWIEIYLLPGEGLINLAGYYLTDDPDSLDKWKFPDTNLGLTTIVAGQHKLVWADKDTQQGELHTNFKLSGDGETIYLVMPDAVTIIDSVSYPMQAPDISYGRECDGCENWIFFNNTTPDDPNQEITPEPQVLFINEVLADNVDYIHDSEDEYEPWIEIYNPNPFQVNLAGYFVSNTSDTELWQFPNDNPVLSVIPAEDFIILWCDAETGQAENHTNFTLDPAGGTITLTASDGSNVDTYSYAETAPNVSWGRQDDGSPNSMEFNIPTPRVTNGLIIVQPELLYINEVLPANNTDTLDNHLQTEDWFEIYNPNNYDVNIAGYYFSDNPENPKKWKVPNYEADSTTVPANGWLLFWADEDQTDGINHTNFRLNNNAEILQMFSPDGFTMVDEIEWADVEGDRSLGRITDGASQWVEFIGTTPEASNNAGDVRVEELTFTGKALLAYPNPVTGERVHFSEQVSGSLYTASGVWVKEVASAKYVETSGLSNGMYYFRSADGRSIKLVVNR
ncbi:MAG: lamin tail domain-containing protein [Flavobacteriales bacterium]|nr:lamin tail domain-containing protein [Flavobacteriales bacterium]